MQVIRIKQNIIIGNRRKEEDGNEVYFIRIEET